MYWSPTLSLPKSSRNPTERFPTRLDPEPHIFDLTFRTFHPPPYVRVLRCREDLRDAEEKLGGALTAAQELFEEAAAGVAEEAGERDGQ